MMRPERLLLVLAISLTGCADAALRSEVNNRVEHAHAAIETAKAPAAEKRADPLEVTDSVWLGDTAVALQRGKPLPVEWEQDDSIALRSDNPLSLPQIISIVSSQTRIPFRMTGGATDGEGAAATPSANTDPNAATAAGASGIMVSYEGKLSGLLDFITSYFNVNWSYDGVTVNVSRYETRTFVLDARPGSISVSSPGDSGASDGASGSATAEPLATASIDIWADITGIINDLVGGEGSVTISQSSGTVVVSTTRDRMERVASYIQQENARLSRQVAINIEMYTVDLTDEQSYALSMLPNVNLGGWLGEQLSLDYTGVPITASDISGATVTIELLKSGSQGVFQALNKLGQTTRVAQIPLTTLNNRPATQRIATDQTYVAETSVTVDGTSGATTTEITTDTAVTGVSVSVLPRLMNDGRMLLQYALAQGALVNLETFTTPDGSASVQLPETQGLSFSQQVMMRNGSTLILAGFDQSDADDKRESPVRGIGWLVGGKKMSANNRRIVVIAITPKEIVVSSPEAS